MTTQEYDLSKDWQKVANDRTVEIHRLMARVQKLEQERYDPEWLMPTLIAHVRELGCKCETPLIGYSPGYGPRCRLCGVDAEDRIKVAVKLSQTLENT